MTTRFLIASLVLIASSSFAQQAPAGAGRAAAPPAPVVAPFPAGAKIAFVNIQAIIQGTVEGKADNAKVDALLKKKQSEAAAGRGTPQDAQKFQAQAQQEIQQLQMSLQQDFQRKLTPILQQIAQEKKLSMLLSAADAGLIWAEPGLDLTPEAIKRLDAATAAPKK